MPWLKEFANQNINFTNHYATSSQAYLNNFSLFYGLDPNYYNSILAGHKTSVLFDTVTKQHYNIGLFSADGFSEPLYRYALLSNFSIPNGKKQTNKLTTDYWMAWHDEQNKLENHAPLFSVIQYSFATKNKKIPMVELEAEAKKLDQYLESLIAYLKLSNTYENTIIIITGSNDLKIDEAKKLVQHNTENSFNREVLKVPLIISWPGREIKQISNITSETDILRTLMQDAFNVTTPAQQYSQGQNLFDQRARQWIVAGSENQVAALYDDKTVVIDAYGRSKIYDLNGKQLKNEKISLPTFLQIVTENRRFIVVDN